MLAKLKSRGVLYSVGIVINRVVPEFLFRARVFCVFRFSRPDASTSQSSYEDGIRFEWCKNDSQFALAKQLTYFQPTQRTDQQSPFRACLAFDGDEAVGGVWIANGSYDESELGLEIQLRPHQSWLFAANIAKSHRQRGIYGRLLQYVLTTANEEVGQQSEVLASINPTNKPSMAAHRRMIDETLGKCVAARFLSLAICRSGGKLITTRSIGLGKKTAIKS